MGVSRGLPNNQDHSFGVVTTFLKPVNIKNNNDRIKNEGMICFLLHGDRAPA
jgi:hypothetical protein